MRSAFARVGADKLAEASFLVQFNRSIRVSASIFPTHLQAKTRMTSLHISDLSSNKELDGKAMTAVRGGDADPHPTTGAKI